MTPSRPVIVDPTALEPIVGATLAAPQVDQLAALLPDTTTPLAPNPALDATAGPAATDALTASAPLVGDQLAQAVDGTPQIAAADPAFPAPAVDLGPMSGPGASASTDIGMGLIKVTALTPEIGALTASFAAPSFAPSTSDFGGLSSSYGSLAPTPIAVAPIRAVPQDHNLIVPAQHAAPTPEAHATPAAPSAPTPAAAPPASQPAPAPAAQGGGDNDVVVYLGVGASGSDMLLTSGSIDIAIDVQTPDFHGLSAEPGKDGTWTFTQGDQVLTLAPDGHGTIGSGSSGYTIDLGAHGSITITGNSPITLTGGGTLSGSVTLVPTEISTFLGGGTVGGSLTVSAAGAITQTTAYAAGYTVAEHTVVAAGQPDPHLHP